MRSYIIHMPGHDKRHANARRLCTILPGAQILDAVIGRDIVRNADFPIRPGDMHNPQYPFPLSTGEIGCFLSHRACWRRIIDDGLQYALIAEDDLAIDPAIWPEVLSLIHSHASAESYIRIPAKTRETAVLVIARQGRAKLFLPRIIGLQTVCQLVGRNAAKRLLAASAVLDRPVDSFVQMHRVTGQQVHTILPNGVRELTAELGGSGIQKKTRASGKLTREIKRAWYRTQISLRPQKP
jgi:glycosyl transferase, family 25